MVSAEKARKVADSNGKSRVDWEIDKIDRLIKTNSEKGMYDARYKIDDYVDLNLIQRILEENGYQVAILTTRECDYLVEISWRGEKR